MAIKGKKGTAIFFVLMMGIVFFVLGLAIAPAIQEVTWESTHNDYYNCSDSSISNQDKAVCTQTDAMMPLYVGIVFGLAGILIGAVGMR